METTIVTNISSSSTAMIVLSFVANFAHSSTEQIGLQLVLDIVLLTCRVAQEVLPLKHIRSPSAERPWLDFIDQLNQMPLSSNTDTRFQKTRFLAGVAEEMSRRLEVNENAVVDAIVSLDPSFSEMDTFIAATRQENLNPELVFGAWMNQLFTLHERRRVELITTLLRQERRVKAIKQQIKRHSRFRGRAPQFRVCPAHTRRSKQKWHPIITSGPSIGGKAPSYWFAIKRFFDFRSWNDSPPSEVTKAKQRAIEVLMGVEHGSE